MYSLRLLDDSAGVANGTFLLWTDLLPQLTYLFRPNTSCRLATLLSHTPFFTYKQKISLHNLAVLTGFIANTTGQRAFRVGTDASSWMCRACALHGNTESPELVALFGRCARLFGLPFIPIFVFDGPLRPSMKRGKIVKGNDHWLTKSFQLMLEGFGFDWITAPSAMSSTGVPCRSDAILTDDSDAFVSGAEMVLQICSEDNRNYSASQYSRLGLTRYDFILIALLAGGDYSDGLDGCGITTAVGLAQAGLGCQLFQGLNGLSYTDSSACLNQWRLALQSDTDMYPALAAKIPDNFPALDIIHLYLHPIVAHGSTPASLSLNSPRLDVLARFAEAHFAWGDSVGILTHFADRLFAGLVVRGLVHAALALDDPHSFPSSFSPPPTIGSIVGDRAHISTGFLAELRLVPQIGPDLLRSALNSIEGRRDAAAGAQAAVSEWINNRLPKARASLHRHVPRGRSANARSRVFTVTHHGQEVLELISDSDGEL
ncbi:PIN domain-like protein [Favolaschia claudopus]|uniref:PIN domain-like protein n=1 Tax=Favolaschia claudopus TaxID=2862362 RepID=A0AAW0BLZ4_9AGAR